MPISPRALREVTRSFLAAETAREGKSNGMAFSDIGSGVCFQWARDNHIRMGQDHPNQPTDCCSEAEIARYLSCVFPVAVHYAITQIEWTVI